MKRKIDHGEVYENYNVMNVSKATTRDLEDIRSILVKNPKYDFDYISGWLKEFDQSLNQNFLETFRKTQEEIREVRSRS